MEVIMFLFMLLVCILVYFLPSIVAQSKQHKNLTGITLLNLFLGWSFLGWVAALVWAVQVQDNKNES